MLEITENVLLMDSDETTEKLSALKELGIRLAIDDFGTGYSSLNYLQRFPIDIVKIDKSFVDGVDAGLEGSAIVRAAVQLGQTFRLETVAEGIEAESQARELRSLECELGQGFFFAKPLDAEGIERFLESERGHGSETD